MVSRFEVFLRRLRRTFSRSMAAVYLLRLPRLTKPAATPGLVMVQIDGLSRTQFERALHKGRMPFLRSLIAREHYKVHTFYSGIPSNTPSVQGELFYGVKSCVPSFSFVDRTLGQPIRMFDAHYVEGFEPRLKALGEGLLKGGSSYSNIYTGGAEESHFCFAKLGWDGLRHAVNPLVFPFLVLIYLDIFVRTGILLAVEFLIASFECIRGTLKGRLFLEELRFVWLRVLICVFLREFMVAGVCMDIMRGLPVIHLNFLGYDEQAHCRGPFSAFAHWSLRGIDDAIKRIDDVIHKSPHRSYDLWVYSDHGQEKTAPYLAKHGRTVEQAVEEMFGATPLPPYLTPHRGSRAVLLRARKLQHRAPLDFSGQEVMVTAMGPLGQVYIKKPLDRAQKEFYARRLVSELEIPLVLMRGEAGKVNAFTSKGSFVLPEQAAEVFGADHPFLQDLKEDILLACHHPDAGELTIAGWSLGHEPISFPIEYGAHASMGPEETRAFALLPPDAPLAPPKPYIRALDLRKAAQRHLNKERPPSVAAAAETGNHLRFMSYNVHGCLGMDGIISAERIGRVIARHNPDIIALQEVDVGRSRSKGMDQAGQIAQYLEMKYHFHSVMRQREGEYGNVIVSRYPLTLVKMGLLPQINAPEKTEPRGAMWVALEYGGRRINIINTHLSIWPRERLLQAKALMGDEWLGPDNGPAVLCGDFNARPGSAVYRMACRKFQESQVALKGHRPYATWFGRYPITRIDYVFITAPFQVKAVAVPRTRLERIASDHLPLIVDLEV